MSFDNYKLLILPDVAGISDETIKKVKTFINNGGKVIASAKSIVKDNKFVLDFGAEYLGENEFYPTYLVPHYETVNGVTEYVMPIFVNNQLVCMVAASGFYGKISERTERILGKRVGIDYIEFSSFRKASLKNAADENTLSDALSILCHLLVRFISDNTDIPKRISSMQYTANVHVLKAVEYIAHSFSDTISAEDVANHCHINLSYLQHLFSSFLGHGIAEQIRLCRLAYAEELLCTTDYSVRYIALISGFSSPDYFSTAFCKHFGISPLKYRSAYKR